jgi:hypothetical protein
MITMSAGGMSIAEPRIARACNVWIEATCTACPGRGGKPSLNDRRVDTGRVQLRDSLPDDLAPVCDDQDAPSVLGGLGDDGSCDHGLARAGRRDQQHPTMAGGDLCRNAVDDVELIAAKL